MWKSNKKAFLAGCFMWLCSFIVISQTHLTFNYSEEKGLPSNRVNCMLRDAEGQTWIGTENGLTKWASNFTTYTTQNGLPGDVITALAADGKQQIWIGTRDKGLTVYDGIEFKNFTTQNGLSSNQINKIHISKNTQLVFIATQNGLTVNDGKNFTRYKSSKWNVSDFLENDTSVWFTTIGHGMHYYHFATKKIYPLDKNQKFFSWSAQRWLVTPNGDTLVATNNKLKVVLGTKYHEITFPDSITDLVEDPQNNRWVSTMNKSHSYSSTGIYKIIKNTPVLYNDNLNLPDHSITCLLFNRREQALMIGTHDHGLFILPGLMFEQFDAEHLGKYHSIQDITEDTEGNIWVSGSRIWKIAPNDSILVYPFDANNQKKQKNHLLQPLMHENAKIITNPQGGIIISCPTHLHNFNGQGKSSVIRSQNDSCRLLMITKKKQPICALGNQLQFCDYPSFNVVRTVTLDHPVDQIKEMSDGYWIISKTKGLYWLSNTFELKRMNSQLPFSSLQIAQIETDSYNHLIISDTNGNIYLLKKEDQQLLLVDKWSVLHHFWGTTTRWILCDRADNLWIGTDKGLNKISLTHYYLTRIPEFQTWSNGEGFNNRLGFKAIETKNGNIWVISENKIVRFNPKQLILHEIKPSIKLVQIIKKSNSKYWIEPKKSGSWVEIPLSQNNFNYQDNSLSFKLLKLNTINKDQIWTRYLLKPSNDEWSTPTQHPYILFPHLSEGTYTLVLQSYFESTPHKITQTEYSFTIHPVWYRSNYAYIAYMGIFLFLVVVLVDSRIQKIRREDEVKMKITERMALLKMEALQAQMNPHFIFNALNSLQYNILENNTMHSLEFIGEFSKLIRRTLDNASKHFITLKEEIDYIENYLKVEQMRYLKTFHYSISLAESVDPRKFYIPPMLIQPHVENAIKYSLTSNIGYSIISFSIIQEKLICMIEDNGIGRANSSKLKKTHQSKGLSLTNERFNLLNVYYKKNNEYRLEIEDLVDNEGNASGTRVTLIFPIVLETDEQLIETTKF